jgi:hypothetical protein
MASSSVSSGGGGSSHRSPILFLGLGAVLFLFWIMASLLQIQTSEAFILQGPTVGLVPHWSILHQPVDFIQGHLDATMTKAVMWGWGIELLFLICIVGYEIAHVAVRSSHSRFGTLFQTAVIGVIAFDAYTDFQYGQMATGFGGQLAFALITGVMVMFFGVVGIRFIEHAIKEWSS